MDRLHIVVAEIMGTDGEFFAETYPCKSDKEAFDTGCNLIAEMAETMGVELSSEDICATTELSGDGWWYRVHDDIHDGFL